MSMFSKVRALTLGNMHELLDKVVDLNSPAVLKQYVRDLEGAIQQLKTEAAVQGGAVRTMKREIGDLQSAVNTKTASIKARLATPNVTMADPAVRLMAAQVNAEQKELAQKQTDLPGQEKVVAELDAAVAKLETKHTDMVSNVRRLESAAHTTTAKNHAVSALEQAGSIASSTDSASIDNLQEKVRANADIADEKFSRAMGNDAFAESPEQTSEVDSLLASLK